MQDRQGLQIFVFGSNTPQSNVLNISKPKIEVSNYAKVIKPIFLIYVKFVIIALFVIFVMIYWLLLKRPKSY